MKVKTILVFCLVIMIVIPSEGFHLKDAWKKVTEPFENLFGSKKSSDTEGVREQGHLASPVRDFVNDASQTVNGIGDTISTTFSKVTKGLDCNKTFAGEAETFRKRIKAILPGTKWCGDGTLARSFDEVGKFFKTDKCCRDHDVCSDNIPAGTTKYGLQNTGLFTRSSCTCDANFYNCLKNAGTLVSRSIGYTYFSVLGPQCFEEHYPILTCSYNKRKRCVQYERDYSKPKEYQWIDNPTF